MSTTLTASFLAHSLLFLASHTLRLLHAHYTQQYEASLATGDDDSEGESADNLNDVDIMLPCLLEMTQKRLQDDWL